MMLLLLVTPEPLWPERDTPHASHSAACRWGKATSADGIWTSLQEIRLEHAARRTMIIPVSTTAQTTPVVPIVQRVL